MNNVYLKLLLVGVYPGFGCYANIDISEGF